MTALKLTHSDFDAIMESKAIANWKKRIEAEGKRSDAHLGRLDTVAKLLAGLGKIMAGRR